MLKNLIEKVEQKSLSLYDMLLTMISIIIGLITLCNSISNNYQHNEMISFYSQLLIFVSIIVVGIYFIKKFIGPPGNEKFNELNPLEKGPVGRKKEIHLLLNFLKSKSDTKNLLILTGDSGCGKTSFITAGIIPNPKLKEIDNILIRFEQYEDYHESLQKEIKEALQDNIIFGGESLTSYVDIANSYGKRLIFIFDQFEQLFIGDSSLKEKIINEIQSVLGQKKDVKIIIIVRNESFKDTLMSFYNEDNPMCSEFCQSTQVIDLPLLNEKEAKEFLKEDLAPELFDKETCQEVVDDLKSIGPGNGKILPISLRIVSRMIARNEIATLKKYKHQGRVSGLQKKYIHIIFNNLKNSKVVPRVIFSLCEPAIGSVVLKDVEIESIAQIPSNMIQKTREEMVEKCLIKKSYEGHYRIVHEYIGELLQEQGGKYISPIELQELRIRRKIKFSQGINVLDKIPVILLKPTKRSRVFGKSICSLGVIILLLRFFIGGWPDLMYLSWFYVGIAIALMSYNYHVNLLSRIWELENWLGKILSALMAIVFLPAAIFLFIRPGWWPFVASSLAFFGAIKDLQISSWCKSSPSLKTTFRYWSASMGALSVTLLLIGFEFDSLRMAYDLVNIQHTNFILLSIAIILSGYIVISSFRFYSLSRLRPIISRINLEVLRSKRD